MTKIFAIFSILFSCLTAAPAYSAWSDVFPGQPQRPDPYTNLPAFIVADAGCDSVVSEVVKDILDYGKAAWELKKSDAEKAEKKIQELIFPKQGQPTNCVFSAERAYAVASTFLLGYDNVWNGFSNSTFGGHRLSNGLEFILLSAFLANQGKIRFLDDAWKSRSSVNSRVRGAYDCADSAIYLDPRLHPINLAATLLHEMDHLFRDKFVSVQDIQSEFFVSASDGSKDGWSSFILMDEALAIVQSTFEQRRLQGTGKVSVPAFWPGGGRYHDVTPFQLKDDDNFFSPTGPLNELTQSCNWGLDDESKVLPEFLETVFLHKDKPMSCNKDAIQGTDREKIYETIYDSYFPGAGSISAPIQAILSPSLHGLELGQLSTWIQQHKIIMGDSVHEVGVKDFDYPENQWIWSDLGHSDGFVVYEMDQFIDALTAFKSKIASSSQACDLYSQAVASGALSHYVGTQVGGRPSTDGVRPVTSQSVQTPVGQSAIDPGANLPGADHHTISSQLLNSAAGFNSNSATPTLNAPDVMNSRMNPAESTDGVRPSLDTLRPCFDLNDQI